ncbi:protease pro-enzyme activation domain-containing protein [Dyella acidisoli]|uniref:Peptidase S53 activation domain-containing protein n=1 Tax=Dyella acidisoli TaxID=1867834 RepID=A0ABQ5XRT6_9GAMM|nr:protease pro-enzyme activation domain-containing protein [Dyella acidisoli]GLQ93094.1 hypothetical protein GCM10007901_20450 [Dyella acidisoli]
MSTRVDRTKYGKTLLFSIAWQMVATVSIHAGEAWVPTHTHATIVKSEHGNLVTLALEGRPTIDASRVAPLEESQPLHIAVSLEPRNQDQFRSFIQGINDPGSPNYHHYLTAEQLKAQYSPTEQQVKVLVDYLKGCGFTNIQVAPNNMLVTADGHASNVNAAFHAEMKRFVFDNASHFGNAEDITVPPSLGGIVDAVLGLQDVSKPHILLQDSADVPMN